MVIHKKVEYHVDYVELVSQVQGSLFLSAATLIYTAFWI